MSDDQRITCPDYPAPLMRPHGSQPTHTARELMELLVDHYRSATIAPEVTALSKTDLESLVAGLVRDFVPIFRKSKNKGRRSNLPEWTAQFDTDPPDLRQLLELAVLVKKYSEQLGSETAAFAHIAMHKHKELPSMFRDRRTGRSLKQAYYKVFAHFDDAPWMQEQVRNDPDDAQAEKRVTDLIAKLTGK